MMRLFAISMTLVGCLVSLRIRMKPQKGMHWKVTLTLRDGTIYDSLGETGHIGKYIKLLKKIFKGSKVIERWQEPVNK